MGTPVGLLTTPVARWPPEEPKNPATDGETSAGSSLNQKKTTNNEEASAASVMRDLESDILVVAVYTERGSSGRRE